MAKKNGAARPHLAEIHFYAQCTVVFSCGEKKVIWVAAISYFFEHYCRVWFGFPVEVWSRETYPDIFFIPLSDIVSRVAYAESCVNFGRLQGKQNVLIAVPVASS